MITNLTNYRKPMNDIFNFSTFDEIFNSPFNFNLSTVQTNVEQIKKEDGSFILNIDALGHDPNDIDIDITPTSLKIKSEKTGDVSELIKSINLSYKLGSNIDIDKIEANFNNGILNINIPIRNEAKTDIVRKLKIKN